MNTENKKNYLLTPRQARTRVLHDELIRDFAKMYRDNPDVTPNRIVDALTEKYGITTTGVRYILKAHGIYETVPGERSPRIHTDKFPTS